MADLVVIVPSRGRPTAAAELQTAFAETCTADTFLLFAVNDDDPTLEGAVVGEFGYWSLGGSTSGVSFVPAKTMVEALNRAAGFVADLDEPPFAIGFMGDDHRPRTQGWDKEYLDALRELGTGIVYGDDKLQGANLPTQCAMTADIVRALGFMAPPVLRHMYVDNFWLDLGTAVDRLFYLPDVVVEHMHPIAGKAEWDEGHKRVNATEVYDADAAAYAEYQRTQFAADVAKVKALP